MNIGDVSSGNVLVNSTICCFAVDVSNTAHFKVTLISPPKKDSSILLGGVPNLLITEGFICSGIWSWSDALEMPAPWDVLFLLTADAGESGWPIGIEHLSSRYYRDTNLLKTTENILK